MRPSDPPGLGARLDAARDRAVATVLRRRGLEDRRFHNESLVYEVADAVRSEAQVVVDELLASIRVPPGDDPAPRARRSSTRRDRAGG